MVEKFKANKLETSPIGLKENFGKLRMQDSPKISSKGR